MTGCHQGLEKERVGGGHGHKGRKEGGPRNGTVSCLDSGGLPLTCTRDKTAELDTHRHTHMCTQKHTLAQMSSCQLRTRE